MFFTVLSNAGLGDFMNRFHNVYLLMTLHCYVFVRTEDTYNNESHHRSSFNFLDKFGFTCFRRAKNNEFSRVIRLTDTELFAKIQRRSLTKSKDLLMVVNLTICVSKPIVRQLMAEIFPDKVPPLLQLKYNHQSNPFVREDALKVVIHLRRGDLISVNDKTIKIVRNLMTTSDAIKILSAYPAQCQKGLNDAEIILISDGIKVSLPKCDIVDKLRTDLAQKHPHISKSFIGTDEACNHSAFDSLYFSQLIISVSSCLVWVFSRFYNKNLSQYLIAQPHQCSIKAGSYPLAT